MDEYPAALLRALEDWLNQDSARRLERASCLKVELEHVEQEFKECMVECYRRIDFSKDPRNPNDPVENRGVSLPLLDLLHTGKLPESISSWTTDPQVARDHREGVQADSICVIFKHMPRPNEVWLDLSALLKTPGFQKALRRSSFPAIQSWMTRESEVILEAEYVTPEDVYAWGSFAGSVDQLRHAAALEGKSSAEIAALESELKRLAGQESWLSEERSIELARRMQKLARQRYIHPPPPGVH
jgi:hypothetical protein